MITWDHTGREDTPLIEPHATTLEEPVADTAARPVEVTPTVTTTFPGRSRWHDFGPALTFMPFLRSIGLSFFITDPQGNPKIFNNGQYYARILNLDGSGRTEYLRSIGTTIQF